MKKYVYTLIKRKVALTILLAIGIVLIGILYWVLHGDRIFLILCLSVALFSIVKAVNCVQKYKRQQIEEIVGMCEAIFPKPFTRYTCIHLATDDNTLELWVPKQTKLRIGSCYCLYYWQHGASTGIDSIDARICSDMFLGYRPRPIEQLKKAD